MQGMDREKWEPVPRDAVIRLRVVLAVIAILAAGLAAVLALLRLHLPGARLDRLDGHDDRAAPVT